MQAVKQMPIQARRRAQADVGLVPTTKPEKKEREMEKSTSKQENQGRSNRAQDTLERLMAPLSFKEVATQELKKAAVWAPILMGIGTALLAVRKRFF